MAASSKADMLSAEEQQKIFLDEGVKWLPEVLPGIEITHFAVNDNYRRITWANGKPVKGLGAYFYPEFIYPIIEEVGERIGVNMIYLYAAGDEKLVFYYKSVVEFQSLQEEDVYMPLEPDYDGGCAFMYRLLRETRAFLSPPGISPQRCGGCFCVYGKTTLRFERMIG